jgi:benzoylformate decarboxylase
VQGLARALGCPAVRVDGYADLVTILDDALPALAQRETPLVVEVAVRP